MTACASHARRAAHGVACNADMPVTEVRQPQVQAGRCGGEPAARSDEPVEPLGPLAIGCSPVPPGTARQGRCAALAHASWHGPYENRVGQAIADLAGSESIQTADVAEALQYRPKLMLG